MLFAEQWMRLCCRLEKVYEKDFKGRVSKQNEVITEEQREQQ
jgi:hypothetical protein